MYVQPHLIISQLEDVQFTVRNFFERETTCKQRLEGYCEHADCNSSSATDRERCPNDCDIFNAIARTNLESESDIV